MAAAHAQKRYSALGPFSTSTAAPATNLCSAGLSCSRDELLQRRDLTKADLSISCGSRTHCSDSRTVIGVGAPAPTPDPDLKPFYRATTSCATERRCSCTTRCQELKVGGRKTRSRIHVRATSGVRSGSDVLAEAGTSSPHALKAIGLGLESTQT